MNLRPFSGVVSTLIAAILGLVVGLVGGLYAYDRVVIWQAIETMKEALISDFNDPESSRFRGLQLHWHHGTLWQRLSAYSFPTEGQEGPVSLREALSYENGILYLCGDVNTKNVLGAYVGYRPFVAHQLRRDGEILFTSYFFETGRGSEEDIEKLIKSACVQANAIFTVP